MVDEIITMLRDSAAGFIRNSFDRARLKGAVGQAPRLDRVLWREMAELGWLSLGLPEESGGSGLGLAAAAALSEVFGRELLPEPYIAAGVMPGEIVRRAGSDDLAGYLCSGERLITLAWQEQPGEMQGDAPATICNKGSVCGQKRFVPVVEDDSILLTTARADNSVVIVALDAAAEGVTVERQAAGVSSVASVTLEHAQVLGDAPLLSGNEAVAALQAALEAGRTCAAAGLAGLADGALQMTLEYMRARVQFDRPIGSFQTIKHRCVDLKIAASLAGASWREASRCFDKDPLSRETQSAASAAQARCATAAVTTCREAVQMHGAIGFTEEADIGLYLRASLFGESWLGSTVDHRRRFMAGRAREEMFGV